MYTRKKGRRRRGEGQGRAMETEEEEAMEKEREREIDVGSKENANAAMRLAIDIAGREGSLLAGNPNPSTRAYTRESCPMT